MTQEVSILELNDDQVIDYACNVLEQRLSYAKGTGDVLGSPEAVRRFVTLKLATREQEVFAVLFLNARHGLLSYKEMFFGTIDGTAVPPREVVKAALQHNAAALVVVHNHPSLNAEPSQADNQLTARLKEALALVDVRLLDHIVVGGTESVSMAERGLV